MNFSTLWSSLVSIFLLASITKSSETFAINFDDIPLGTTLVDGQYGWYDFGTGPGGQSVALSDDGSNSVVGPGSSGFVSRGSDSINSIYYGSDSVTMEWDIELRGVSSGLFLGRDLDGDGVLENANQSPADQGFEGLIGFRVESNRIRIRYWELDSSGVLIDNELIEWLEFDTSDQDLHCSVEMTNTSSHEMILRVALSDLSGVVADQEIAIDFVGPHLWDEIDGIAIRADLCCTKVDNIVFSSEAIPCPADLTGDGQLDFFDVSGFLVLFQLNDPAADFTGDGQLDFFDVSAFLASYARGCP